MDENSIVFVRDFWHEFATHYRRDDGTDISLSTMIGYLLNVNRVMKNIGVDVNFQTHLSFTDKKHGLTHLLDDKFSMQRAPTVHVVHHNTLPRDDIKTLSYHNVSAMLHPTEHLNRLISIVGVMFKIVPTAMVELNLVQFQYDSLNGKKVVNSRRRLGCILKYQSERRVGDLR